MTKQELINLITNLKQGKEITLASKEWQFGIIKDQMFGTEQIFFGAYGSDVQAKYTDYNTAEEIAEAIEQYIIEFDGRNTYQLSDYKVS
ncbi:hypothetical protein [Bacillus infantis]|uniref:hypothetical protein n=1 Tax=Bacillus infantis TaxID=324767 RepID=UPI003CEE5E84